MPLSDEQWNRVAGLFEEDKLPRVGRPRVSARLILDAVLWVIENNEKWHRLPAEFPPTQTCYNKSLVWKKSGVLDAALKALEGTAAPQMQCGLTSDHDRS